MARCSVPRCEMGSHRRGLCDAHDNRLRRYGSTYPEVPTEAGALHAHLSAATLVCVCVDPTVDVLGECDTCHRKPRDLLVLSANRG